MSLAILSFLAAEKASSLRLAAGKGPLICPMQAAILIRCPDRQSRSRSLRHQSGGDRVRRFLWQQGRCESLEDLARRAQEHKTGDPELLPQCSLHKHEINDRSIDLGENKATVTGQYLQEYTPKNGSHKNRMVPLLWSCPKAAGAG